MKKIMISAFLLLCINAFGQDRSKDISEIKKTIDNLFEGMRKSDTALAASAFNNASIMQTVNKNKEGVVSIQSSSTQKFVTSLAQKQRILDEQIRYESVLIDGDLASVWTPYKFFVDGKFSHCGVNSFQLAKLQGTWKIIYIIDTRRTDNCPTIN